MKNVVTIHIGYNPILHFRLYFLKYHSFLSKNQISLQKLNC